MVASAFIYIQQTTPFAFMILERLVLVLAGFSLPAEYEVAVGASSPSFSLPREQGAMFLKKKKHKKTTAHMNVTVREVLISDRLTDRFPFFLTFFSHLLLYDLFSFCQS